MKNNKLHRFSRTEILIGSNALAEQAAKHAMIFGIGGVGSHAAEALGRAGIGRITLVDFDSVCLTNINRQIHALSSTVGRPKVEVMAERLLDINPDANITPIKAFFSNDNAEELMQLRPDYVLDAIDHFTAKTALIIFCRERNIPIISSMGAANKLDPTKIRVDDISATHNCRMSRSMRKILRQRGITDGVKVVYSTEEHRELSGDMTHCDVQGILSKLKEQTYRRAILGSASYIPAIFGMTMAGMVVNDLLSKTQKRAPEVSQFMS